MNFGEIKDQLKRDLGRYRETAGADADLTISIRVNQAYQGLAGLCNWYWWRDTVSIALTAGQETLSLPFGATAISRIQTAENYPVHLQHADHQEKYAARLNLMGTKRTVAITGLAEYDYFRATSATIANGSSQVVLNGGVFPSDVTGRSLSFDDDGERFIIASRVNDVTAQVDHARQGVSLSATACTVDKRGTKKLRIVPVAQAETYTIRYYFRPAPLLFNSDEPLLPLEFHSYLLAAARVDLLHGIEERQTLWNQAITDREAFLASMRQSNTQGIVNDSVPGGWA